MQTAPHNWSKQSLVTSGQRSTCLIVIFIVSRFLAALYSSHFSVLWAPSMCLPSPELFSKPQLASARHLNANEPLKAGVTHLLVTLFLQWITHHKDGDCTRIPICKCVIGCTCRWVRTHQVQFFTTIVEDYR